MPRLPHRSGPPPLPRPPGPGPGRGRPGERGRPAGLTTTTTEAIAERIDAPTDVVAYLLADELARGRVSRSESGWALVPGSFAPETVEALRTL